MLVGRIAKLEEELDFQKSIGAAEARIELKLKASDDRIAELEKNLERAEITIELMKDGRGKLREQLASVRKRMRELESKHEKLVDQFNENVDAANDLRRAFNNHSHGGRRWFR